MFAWFVVGFRAAVVHALIIVSLCLSGFLLGFFGLASIVLECAVVLAMFLSLGF